MHNTSTLLVCVCVCESVGRTQHARYERPGGRPAERRALVLASAVVERQGGRRLVLASCITLTAVRRGFTLENM